MPRSLFLTLFFVIIVIGFLLFPRKTHHQNLSADKPSQKTASPANKPQKPTFNKHEYSLDNPTSIWVIVNKNRVFNPLSFAPADLVSVGNGQFLRQPAADALAEMSKAASAQGLTLQPMSGYRSYQTQQVVYAREVAINGQAIADSQSAKPGHSEHQTGLAMDLGGGGCGIEDCFGNTAEGKWVAANAYKYGFVIRYPEGKDSVTGYRYEPWHIRYVGKELATEMKRTHVTTLEEFFNL